MIMNEVYAENILGGCTRESEINDVIESDWSRIWPLTGLREWEAADLGTGSPELRAALKIYATQWLAEMNDED